MMTNSHVIPGRRDRLVTRCQGPGEGGGSVPIKALILTLAGTKLVKAVSDVRLAM
jgi:hypothetical protein